MSQKILVVDDEKDLVEMLERRLKTGGYTVVTASNGEEGLKLIRSEEPSLIVVDINMPVMDGYTMIKEMRRENLCKNVPIMVITGRERLKDMLTLEGICDYMIKPFDSEELLSRIQWNIKGGQEKTQAPEARAAAGEPRKRILVVDDDADFLEMIRIRLESDGYEVDKASDGEQAVKKVNIKAPDCIVLDVMMPRLDGFSTLKQINQITNRKVPVIIITGTKAIPEEEFRIEGARAFLRKPFEASVIIKHVKELVV